MKDEVYEYFRVRGFSYTALKKQNPSIRPSHIKAGMVDVWHNRANYRDDQLGRAALRSAVIIDDREEYENELKSNQAVKDLVIEKQRNANLKEKLILFYALLVYFGTIGLIIGWPYLENIK